VISTEEAPADDRSAHDPAATDRYIHSCVQNAVCGSQRPPGAATRPLANATRPFCSAKPAVKLRNMQETGHGRNDRNGIPETQDREGIGQSDPYKGSL